MSGSSSYFDKNRKYEEMLKKIQNPGDPSVCGSMFDSRLGITNNRIDSTLNAQKFYNGSSRSSKNSCYKTIEQSTAETDFSMAQSTKASEYHSTTMGKSNIPTQQEMALISQKSYPQTFERSTTEFCPAPSTSGSLQYPPSESFAFKLPVSTKAFKSTKDSRDHDKYLTRVNICLKVLRPEHKQFVKFTASLMESVIVAYSSIQDRNGHMQKFNYAEMYNTVGQRFLEKHGLTSSENAFSDVSSVTTNSTFYNNDLRPQNPVVLLEKVTTESSQCRAPSQVSCSDQSSRRSQSHSPRREKTVTQRRLSVPKHSLTQECEEQPDMEESSLSLFSANNSIIAQLRDQQALQQAVQQAQVATKSVKQLTKRRSRDTTIKPTPLPKSKNNACTNTVCDRNINLKQTLSVSVSQQEKSSFEVPAGAKGITRTGRAVKSPVKWWEQGANTSKLDNKVIKNGSTQKDNLLPANGGSNKSTKNNLNDSIVLRNNKIVKKSPTDFENVKKITPPINTNKNNDKPVNTKSKVKKNNEENKNGAKKCQRKSKEEKDNGGKKYQKKNAEDKENISVQMKSQKCQKPSKSTVKKTKEALEESKGKSSKLVEKKPVRKRKNEERIPNDAKRKKCEEQVESLKGIRQKSFNSSCEDDIFGNAGYMKSSRPFFAVAVSPTTGMLSAKKDTLASLSKETPPCKALTQFLNTTCQSAASSYHQSETTKQDAVVKRVTNKVKTQKNDKSENKLQTLKKKKVNKKPIASHALTSLDTCSISVVLGNDIDQESDSSHFSDDDLI